MASMASTTAGLLPSCCGPGALKVKLLWNARERAGKGEREHGESKNSHSLTTEVTPEAQLLKATRSREDF